MYHNFDKLFGPEMLPLFLLQETTKSTFLLQELRVLASLLLIIIVKWIEQPETIDDNIKHFKMISIQRGVLVIHHQKNSFDKEHLRIAQTMFREQPKLLLTYSILDHPLNKLPLFARTIEDERQMVKGLTTDRIKRIFVTKQTAQFPDFHESTIFVKLSEVQKASFDQLEDHSFNLDEAEYPESPPMPKIEIEHVHTPKSKLAPSISRAPRNFKISEVRSQMSSSSHKSNRTLDPMSYAGISKKVHDIKKEREEGKELASTRQQEVALSFLQKAGQLLAARFYQEKRLKKEQELEQLRRMEMMSVRQNSIAPSKMTRANVPKKILRREALFGMAKPDLSMLRHMQEDLIQQISEDKDKYEVAHVEGMTPMLRHKKHPTSIPMLEEIAAMDRQNQRFSRVRDAAPLRKRSPLRKASENINTSLKTTGRTFAMITPRLIRNQEVNPIIVTKKSKLGVSDISSSSSSSSGSITDSMANDLRSQASKAPLSIFKMVANSFAKSYRTNKESNQESVPASLVPDYDQAAASSRDGEEQRDRLPSDNQIINKAMVQKWNKAVGKVVRENEEQNAKPQTEPDEKPRSVLSGVRSFKRLEKKFRSKTVYKISGGGSSKNLGLVDKPEGLMRKQPSMIILSKHMLNTEFMTVPEQENEESPAHIPVKSSRTKQDSNRKKKTNTEKREGFIDLVKVQGESNHGEKESDPSLKTENQKEIDKQSNISQNSFAPQKSKKILLVKSSQSKDLSWSNKELEDLEGFKTMLKSKINSGLEMFAMKGASSSLKKHLIEKSQIADKSVKEETTIKPLLCKQVMIGVKRRHVIANVSRERKYLLMTGTHESSNMGKPAEASQSVGYDYIFSSVGHDHTKDKVAEDVKRDQNGNPINKSPSPKDYSIQLDLLGGDEGLMYGKSLSKSGSIDDKDHHGYKFRLGSSHLHKEDSGSSPIKSGSQLPNSDASKQMVPFSNAFRSGSFTQLINNMHKQARKEKIESEVDTGSHGKISRALSKEKSPNGSVSRESPTKQGSGKAFQLTLTRVGLRKRSKLPSSEFDYSKKNTLIGNSENQLESPEVSPGRTGSPLKDKDDPNLLSKKRKLNELAEIGQLVPGLSFGAVGQERSRGSSLPPSKNESEDDSPRMRALPSTRRERNLQRKKQAWRKAKARATKSKAASPARVAHQVAD